MNNIKRLLAISFVVLTIAVCFYLYLPPSSGEIQMMNATLGENRLDVLCVGSSHVQCGINPVQLYRDYGIAAYDLAAGSQAPWQSYYYIREACKTQNPKMIIYDTYMVGSIGDSSIAYEDYQTVWNLLEFPFSINKIRALHDSTADSKLGILLVFPYTYDKAYEEGYTYPGLTIDKSPVWLRSMMGYTRYDTVDPYKDAMDVNEIAEMAPLDEKNEKYLKLIIEYCRDNRIDLVLTNTPWPCIKAEDQKRFNSVQAIADDYGVPFLNGCILYDEMGIDYMTDVFGGGGHLNHSGVTKYTDWMGKYLTDNYSLPDRRGDENYQVYEKEIEKSIAYEKEMNNQ